MRERTEMGFTLIEGLHIGDISRGKARPKPAIEMAQRFNRKEP